MRAIQISDEIYDRLKECVVDPFDDTPESVIGRLIDIVDKATSKWSPLDAYIENSEQQVESQNKRPERTAHWKEKVETAL